MLPRRSQKTLIIFFLFLCIGCDLNRSQTHIAIGALEEYLNKKSDK